MMTRTIMMMMTRNLKMKRCQNWVESPMSRPIEIIIDGDCFDDDNDDKDNDDDDKEP